MENKCVAVIGDIMLDQYHFWKMTRLNPESASALLNLKSSENMIGGAGNVAANLAAMGSETILIGNIGNDSEGAIIEQLTKQHKFELMSIITKQPTITKTRFMESKYKHHLLRVDREEPIVLTLEEETAIVNKLKELKPKYLVVSDYNKGVLSETLIDQIWELPLQLLVDTKPGKVGMYKNMFLLKPNFEEFEKMVGKVIENTNEEIEKYGYEMVQKLQCNLVITRGSEGASLITKEWEYLHLPTVAQSVFDVSGAGDTFMAALVTGLTKNMTLADAVILGNKASAIAVSKFGTVIVSHTELF